MFKLIPSPTELELKILRLERKTVQFLSHKLGRGWIFFVAIVLALLVAQFGSWVSFHDEFSANGGFYVLRLIRIGIVNLILFSPLFLFLPEKSRSVFNFFLMSVTWLLACYFFLKSNHFLINILILFFLPSVSIFAGYLFSQQQSQHRFKLWIFFSIFFIFYFGLICFLLDNKGWHNSLIHFWSFKLPFYWLMITSLVFSEQKTDLNLAFCPANALRGTLWPSASRLAIIRDERVYLWWQGFLQILIGYLIAMLRVVFEQTLFVNTEFVYIKYASKYFLALLAIVSFLNVLTGVARLLGYQVIDGTYFVWLSRRPSEFWRRGVVYHYQFFLRYLYLPIYKKTTSRYFSWLSAFVVFFIFKYGLIPTVFLVLDWFGLSKVSPYYDRAYMIYAAGIWFFWCLSADASSRYWPLKKLERINFKWAWVSILLTHFIMSTIYYLAHLVQLVFLDKTIVW